MDIAALRTRFLQLFPGGDSLIVSRAPGRVNLIGEHTDYNDGFVCPMAIDKSTAILARPRDDGIVRLHSLVARETVEFPVDREVPKEGPTWSLYAKGAAEAMRQRATITRGFDGIADSTVPVGGGLSSSASFEVATAMAVLAVNGQRLPPEDVALGCQWAEHHYPGVPVGIMDQMTSALGQAGHAMLLDCRDRTTRQVPLNDPDLRVVISNSNVKHALVGGEYRARRSQCEEAVAKLQAKFPEVRALRDATMAQLNAVRQETGVLVFQRARHVITEIARTLEFADALARRAYERCGELMYTSHASLRDDYEVSCEELDALVEIARGVPGVYGARMTGGGFGGCIVALCRTGSVDLLTREIANRYPPKAAGKQATTFSTTASQGATVTPL